MTPLCIMRRIWNSPAATLVALLSIHLGLGLGRRDFVISSDGTEYLQMAENLLSTGCYTYDGQNPVAGKPPGFPAFLAGYLWLIGSTTGLHVVQLMMLFGAYCITGMIVARISGVGLGLAVIALLTAAEPLRGLAANLMTEPLFLLLNSAALYTLLRSWDTGDYRWAVGSGLLIAFSTYIRPVNLFWPVAIVVLFWVARRTFWRLGLTVLAVHLVVVAPWMARNRAVFGRVVPMAAHWVMLYYMTDDSLSRVRDIEGVGRMMRSPQYQAIVGEEYLYNWGPNERLRQRAWDNIRTDTRGYLWRCCEQIVFVWSYVPGTREWQERAPVAFTVGRLAMAVFYLLTVLGACAIWRRYRAVLLLCGGYALYTAVVLFPMRTETRYLIPAYLLLLPLTAAGAAWLLDRLRRHRSSPHIVPA